MREYEVLLITNDKLTVYADEVDIVHGALRFYKNGIKTEEEKYPDDITLMILSAGTWTLVTLEETKNAS
jgi:hypothetical protein